MRKVFLLAGVGVLAIVLLASALLLFPRQVHKGTIAFSGVTVTTEDIDGDGQRDRVVVKGERFVVVIEDNGVEVNGEPIDTNIPPQWDVNVDGGNVTVHRDKNKVIVQGDTNKAVLAPAEGNGDGNIPVVYWPGAPGIAIDIDRDGLFDVLRGKDFLIIDKDGDGDGDTAILERDRFEIFLDLPGKRVAIDVGKDGSLNLLLDGSHLCVDFDGDGKCEAEADVTDNGFANVTYDPVGILPYVDIGLLQKMDKDEAEETLRKKFGDYFDAFNDALAAPGNVPTDMPVLEFQNRSPAPPPDMGIIGEQSGVEEAAHWRRKEACMEHARELMYWTLGSEIINVHDHIGASGSYLDILLDTLNKQRANTRTYIIDNVTVHLSDEYNGIHGWGWKASVVADGNFDVFFQGAWRHATRIIRWGRCWYDNGKFYVWYPLH